MTRAPGVFRCLVVVAAADIALRTLGFARTLKLARGLARPAAAPMTDEVMQATLNNIITATAFYPGRSHCLEQAVAAFVLLRRRGVPAHIRLGVQPYPFYAHAWIELNGAPLTESSENVARFALLPDPAL